MTVTTVARTADETAELRVAWSMLDGMFGETKLTDDMLHTLAPTAQRAVWQAAHTYARTCDPRGGFMSDMRANVWMGRTLTFPQARGVLNVMMADARRSLAEKRAARQTSVAPVAPSVAPSVPNGYYTIVFSDGHVTLRLQDDFRADAPAGSQMVAYLDGTDNESDYAGFAFLHGATVRVWGKMSGKVDRQRAALAVLIGATDTKAYGEAYALESGRCYRCGHMLTNPESIARGIGPECLKKEG